MAMLIGHYEASRQPNIRVAVVPWGVCSQNVVYKFWGLELGSKSVGSRERRGEDMC